MDYKEEQKNEIEALESIYPDELKSIELCPTLLLVNLCLILTKIYDFIVF